MKFRKKPIVIEAEQWFPGKDIKGLYFLSQDSEGRKTGAQISTLEGEMEVSEGDWIITGVNGELYPCKPDIFKKTYDKAYGESVDIAIRVVEEPPEDGHGIKFYIIVRVDRHTFGLANVKNAQNLVRQQFQYALPEVLKAVDQEHAILNRPAVRSSK